MNNKIQQIEEFLQIKYNSFFSVSYDKFGYIISPNDYQDFANSIEVEVDSDEFYDFITDLERAVNYIF